MTVELDVPARMRDGATLRADVYRPAGDGPWPTLLARTPYGKDEPETCGCLSPLTAARRGFLVVIQDTRGRFASGGEWAPFRFEREDGCDSVAWAAGLPGSNGRVGMVGDSYVGNAQWMAAAERPPSLGAIAPALTWSEPLDGLLARGGAVELGLTVQWALLTGADQLARMPMPDDERARRLAALLDDFDRLADGGYAGLPVDALPVLRRHGFPDIGAIAMLRDEIDPAWSRVAGAHERVAVPTLNIGAWHDVFVQGTLDNYEAMAALGRPARLVVGPWTHITYADPVGELCYGIRARRAGVAAHASGDLTDLQLTWLKRQLAPDGAPTAEEPGAPVRIFVMGRNAWRDETSWPLTRARAERWFLGPGGALGPSAPAAGGAPAELLYDPADPVPTLGGQTLLSPSFPAGPYDQARIEARPDVLVFTSEPLPRDLEVTGRVRVVLHAESSAPSADWVARLCDVHPDGRSYNVCDGIVRVSTGAERLQRVEIDLWSTSNAFLAGHRLRVHVTSSSFPRWDRNLNTGDQGAARWQTARQRVHHVAEHPSWIELPVVA